MKIQLTIAICALLATGVSVASGDQARLGKELDTISAHIGSHTDQHAVTDSLYRQMRPHVLITNKHLKAAEIDKRVHTYIAKKYSPVLLMNYSLLFSKMRTANKHFSSCDKLQPFEFAKNIKTALCTAQQHGKVQVNYLINDNNKGWEKASIFVFQPVDSTLKLVAIKLKLKKGQKIRVENI